MKPTLPTFSTFCGREVSIKEKIRDFNQKYSKSGAFPLPRRTVSYLAFIIRDRLMNLWLN